MKLNLLPYVAPSKIDQIKENGLPSPIGWWKVTTEGDCEGRTTKQSAKLKKMFSGKMAEDLMKIQ